MRVVVDHKLGQKEATRRVQRLLEGWAGQYGVDVQWSGSSAQAYGKIMGFSFDARIDVRESEVDCDGPDPGFLVRAQVKAYLEDELKRALA